jgi:hypothetical protein
MRLQQDYSCTPGFPLMLPSKLTVGNETYAFNVLLTRQLITTAIVIPAEAGHEVKPWRYPDRYWIPDQVRDDKGWPI